TRAAAHACARAADHRACHASTLAITRAAVSSPYGTARRPRRTAVARSPDHTPAGSAPAFAHGGGSDERANPAAAIAIPAAPTIAAPATTRRRRAPAPRSSTA